MPGGRWGRFRSSRAKSLSEVAVTAVSLLALPPPTTLFLSFLTDFTLDWESDGMRYQISPEFIFARISDFSRPPTLVSVAFM